MRLKLIIFIQRLILGIHGQLFPIINFIVPRFNVWAKNRRSFELLNLSDPHSKSFKEDNKQASIAFEVSSEGELEQVKPLLESFVQEKMLVELIYSSESVEKKCQLLAKEYSEYLRIFRLPLVTYGPKLFKTSQSLLSWCTAKKLVLCRYDFYPELLLLGSKKDVFFILVSATLKNKRVGPFSLPFYNLFNLIIAATELDQDRFVELGYPIGQVFPFDFRIIQVLKRVQNKEQTLGNLAFYKEFLEFLKGFKGGSRLLMGSAWPNEMKLFFDFDFLTAITKGQVHVCIAPHKLSKEHVNEMVEKFYQVTNAVGIDIPCYRITKEMNHEEIAQVFKMLKTNPGVLTITVPGILCELYTDFGNVYVGGGHGRSIHSVLEPYLAGARIYCGPKVHRSTEYDFVLKHSPEYIHIIESLDKFYKHFIRHIDLEIDVNKRNEITGKVSEHFYKIKKNVIEGQVYHI